jgi:signal transduction histidine kinase
MPLNMPTGFRIYEFSMRPALDETGKVIALVPEAVEITARVRAEQALLQSQKLEAIGNLTGGIAHDFNNLLMAILGSLELLRKRLPDDAGLLRLVDIATEGARRGKSLTERMLTFARKQELKPEYIDLGRLVGSMAELMERALGPTISVDIRIEPDLPQVEIDPNQLESALRHRVVNARDAMHGEGSLLIAAREEALLEPHGGLPPGRYVCLSVTDAGEGMDEPTLKRATEPFFTTKGVGKGTGLGLSTVHGLAEQSGGRLILKSSPGTGTTAEIWLPAVLDPVTIKGPTRTTPPRSAETGKRLSILVVDDDSLILMNTADMLEDLGHSVVAVPSGKLALSQLQADKFDLLVTDHAMPQMTGAQLIKEATARYPDMAVILATGYAELPLDTAVPRLRKPYSQADLADALSKVR